MTSFCLKIIAAIAMTVDHAAAIIGQMGLISMFPNMSLNISYHIINVMRGIGRIAYPIFAFLIAEGAGKTRSMPKYIGRLFLFALISEPFFYFALSLESPSISGFFENIASLNLGNVYFTLALAATAIYLYQLIESKKSQHLLLQFAPICLLIVFIGGYIGCDYGMIGILLIVTLYLVKTPSRKCIVVLIWSTYTYLLGQLSMYNVIHCFCSAASCVLIWGYNGKRGVPFKWSFYIYYPLHLLILLLLKYAIR